MEVYRVACRASFCLQLEVGLSVGWLGTDIDLSQQNVFHVLTMLKSPLHSAWSALNRYDPVIIVRLASDPDFFLVILIQW